MQSLHDSYINEGIRQSRVVRFVGGLIGGVSASYLSTYGLTRLLLLGAGYSFREGINPLVYVSAGGLVTAFLINGIANRTTRRIAIRYNERLRTPR